MSTEDRQVDARASQHGRRLLTSWDLILIASLTAGVAVLYVLPYVLPVKTSDIAVVRVDGREILRVSVAASAYSRKTFEIPRGEATVEYGAGRIRLLPLPTEVCPNGICWRTGWISISGQSIVCVPNHMTITLEGHETIIDSIVR